MKSEVFEALIKAAATNEPVALGIITEVKGSSPQKLGAKALFHDDGRIIGTMGGGCLEAEIQKRALTVLRSGQPQSFDLLLDHDFGWDDGLICGGRVCGVILPNAQKCGIEFWKPILERDRAFHWGVKSDFSVARLSEAAAKAEWLYQERVHPPCVLWIAGAGHISQAVAPFALQLDFEVTVLDDRPALANHRSFPPDVHLQVKTWDDLLQAALPDRPAFGLIVTRGHRHDALVLANWIRKPFKFLGMIGSRRKARTIFEHFVEERIATREELERVACPVGLPIGATTVEEIAVSIVAQLVEKRAQRGDLSQTTAANPEAMHPTLRPVPHTRNSK